MTLHSLHLSHYPKEYLHKQHKIEMQYPRNAKRKPRIAFLRNVVSCIFPVRARHIPQKLLSKKSLLSEKTIYMYPGSPCILILIHPSWRMFSFLHLFTCMQALISLFCHLLVILNFRETFNISAAPKAHFSQVLPCCHDQAYVTCLLFSADEMFEQLQIEAFSSPPELPDVMKPQDSGSTTNEQAVQ